MPHPDYPVLIEPLSSEDGGGYLATVPDLPGCVAVGDTEAETLTLIREAIEFHLDGLRQDGDPVPLPSARVEYVEVATAA